MFTKNKPLQKILIFEGIDRSGKTTLRKRLLNYCPNQLTIDRLFASNLVYDQFYKRVTTYDKFMDSIIEKLSESVIIIYVYCDFDTYAKRCVDSNHPILTKYMYDLQQKLYEEVLKKLHMPIVVSCSELDKKKQLNKLIKMLKLYE